MRRILKRAALGVFVGVVALKVLKRTNPKFSKKLQAKIKVPLWLKEVAKATQRAFMEGYKV